MAEELGTAEWYGLWVHGRRIGACINLDHALAIARTTARATNCGVNIRHSTGNRTVHPTGHVDVHERGANR